MTEHIAHHEHVAVLIFHTDSVHAQELRQKCVPMTLHYVLGKETRGWDKERPAERHSQHRDRGRAAQKPPDFCCNRLLALNHLFFFFLFFVFSFPRQGFSV